MAGTVRVSRKNIHIPESYTIGSREKMVALLDWIDSVYHETCLVLQKRSQKSLIREWRGHNFVYEIGLFRSRTADVDLNYPQKWYAGIIYFVGSALYSFVRKKR